MSKKRKVIAKDYGLEPSNFDFIDLNLVFLGVKKARTKFYWSNFQKFQLCRSHTSKNHELKIWLLDIY